MKELIEVVESKIVPRDLPRTMWVRAPNGDLFEAPVEAWISGLIRVLPAAQQARLFEVMKQLTPAEVGTHGHLLTGS